MRQGLFITFEGIDGCGKSTQVRLAEQYLVRSGIPCIVTREPGGTAIGEKIRGILLDPLCAEMCHQCEVLLYLASRAQHVAQTVKPALDAGAVVLCDRFSDATIAYQGYGRGLDIDTLWRLNEYASLGVAPDCSMVFDLPVEVAARRLVASGKSPDRMESSGMAFQQKVREGYLDLAQRNAQRVVVVNADGVAEEIGKAVGERISGLLSRSRGGSVSCDVGNSA